tara:strand:+ start:696 stop:911 length:216 start_codon:yes stop_codon:yes gene_type:complete
MKILFNNGEGRTLLEVYQSLPNEMTLSVIEAKSGDNGYSFLDYHFNPDELREFIGALLHVQQKLNKGGKHE